MLKGRFFKIVTPIFLFLFWVQVAHAGFLDDAGMSPECMENGQCGFNDVALGFLSLIKYLLGSIAALALVFLIWGGVQWVWSGGNADKVKRGKDIFFNTIAALVLAFGSYMITAFFINDILLGGDEDAKYRVTADNNDSMKQCRFQEMGTMCGDENGYFCAGDSFGEKCLTGCQIMNLTYKGFLESVGPLASWRCTDRDTYNWWRQDAWIETDLCPGPTNVVCTLFMPSISGQYPITQSYVDDNYPTHPTMGIRNMTVPWE